MEHPHAAGKLEAMRSLPHLWRVVGIAESDNVRRSALARSNALTSVPLMDEATLLSTPGLQAVAIETNLSQATDAAMRALSKGKHIHLDKPGGANHQAFRQMRLEAQRLGLTVQMGYMLRYNPAFEVLFKAVKEGWLGRITEIDCAMGKLADPATRTQLLAQPGGAMFEIGCHLIDIILSLLGRPERVESFGSPSPTDGLFDNQLAVLVYPGATACVRTNFADPFGGPRRRFNVTGTEGTFEILPLESGRIQLSLARACGDYKKGIQTVQLPVSKSRYELEFVDLARVVRGEKPLAWNAEHDIAVHEVSMRAAGIWQ
jgi:predicted dehydrogenase